MTTSPALPQNLTDHPFPPGPTGLPLLGVLPDWRRDPLKLLESAWRTHGSIFTVPLGVRTTMITAPHQVKHLLQDNHLNYVKGFDYQRMEPLLGQGLLTSNGEVWKRHRRLAQPSFHRERLAGFAALMVRKTHEMLERWRALGPRPVVELHAQLMRLTLEIVSASLFSAQLGDVTGAVGEALGDALRMTDERVNSVMALPLWVPTPFNLRYRKRLEVLDTVVCEIIAARRHQAPSDDLLSMLMLARDEGSGRAALDDRALRDEVMTMILAGHETTANALTFAQLLLTQHPAIEQRLRASVDAGLEGRDGTSDLSRLTYTRQVAEEAMRLYPPAWLFGRQALADDVIDGFKVPAKSLVLAVPYLTHRDPNVWPDPERFDPERFSPEQAANRHRFAYYPFSAGPRQCIGNGFAMMELQLVLATLSQHVSIQVLEPERVEVETSITLRPKNAMHARVEFR